MDDEKLKRIITSRTRNIIWILGLLLMVTGCQKPRNAAGHSEANPAARSPHKVEITRLTPRPMERIVVVTGTLASLDQATLSVKVPGRMFKINVDLGSKVQQGELIAQLDPTDYQLRVRQAEAALAQARARLGLSPGGNDDRVEPEKTSTARQAYAVLNEAKAIRDRSTSLLLQGLISQSQFDVVEANYQIALSRYQDSLEEIRNREAVLAQRRSELALARQQLADSALYAPFDGSIQQRQATMGEYLAAASPVVTLVRMDPLRLRAEVPERQVSSIKTGQAVRVNIEGDLRIYTGHIVRLSPVIAEQTRMLLVEAEVANPGTLRPGSFARVSIITDESGRSPALPDRCIITFAGIEKVILAQEGKALERPITTGRRTQGWIEVLSGVDSKDLVIVNPGNLQSGQPIEIKSD